MGENLRKGQCEAFKKGTDLAMIQMSSPSLIQRPDLELFRHDADLLEGNCVAVGDTLFAQQSGDRLLIFLSKGSDTVATIEGEGAVMLIETLEPTDCPGFAQVIVVDVCDISDSITVQLLDEEEDER